MFYAHDARCEQEQNDKKSFLRQGELRFPRRSCAKLGLGLAGLYFGGVWDALGRSLGVTWSALGRSWAALDPSWALLGSLGRFLGTLGRLLANLRCLSGAS